MVGRALVLGLAVFAAATAHAQSAVPELTGRVVDLAEIVPPTVEAVLTDRLAAFEDTTGHQLAVLTVPSLQGAVLEEYATEVFRTWGLGDADRNDGLLLLVARDDRKIRIEVGYGLEGEVTDALAGRIIRDEMTPRFRAGDFGGGITSAADALMGATTGTYTPPSQFASFAEDIPPGIVLISLVLMLPLWLWLAWYGSATLRERVGMAISGWLVSLFIALGVSVFTETGYAFLLTVPLALAYFSVDTVLEAVAGRRRAIRRRALAIAGIRSSRIAAEKNVLFKAARKRGDDTVVYGGKTIRVPPRQSSSGSGSSSWSSSSGSSRSSSSFSGGGGSSGGGGASGGW